MIYFSDLRMTRGFDVPLNQIARFFKRFMFRTPPPAPQASSSLETAHNALSAGDFLAAEVAFRDAIQRSESRAQVALSAGLALAKRNRISSAIVFLTDAVKEEPRLTQAHATLGSAYFSVGQIDEAEKYFNSALTLDPNCLPALCNLGAILTLRGRFIEATTLLKQAISFKPDFAEAYNQLGLVYKSTAKLDKAIYCFRDAIRFNAQLNVAYGNLIECLCTNQQFDEADEIIRRMESNPLFERSDVLEKTGAICSYRGDPIGAKHAYRQALNLNPNNAALIDNLAMVLQDLGNVDEAIALHTRAIELSPDFKTARWHRSIAYLKLFRFGDAWQEYELRLLDEQARKREFPFPRWQGHTIENKTLLIHAEQGLGDEIMFASCIPDSIAVTGHCVIECHSKLEALYRRSFPDATILGGNQQDERDWRDLTPKPDVFASVGSLPQYFRTSVDHFPNRNSYLRADDQRISHWRTKLSELGKGVKIGISWRGGSVKSRGAMRSIPLKMWGPILKANNAQFVSLQYTECSRELQETRDQLNIEIMHWDEAIENYDDTAALVTALDLVISVQTAIVHLSGALGKNAWVMVPTCAEWRYGISGNKMPWYPSIEIFRQSSLNNWAETIETVAHRLTEHIRELTTETGK